MTVRAFIGIELPDDVRAVLAIEQERLRGALASREGIAWVKPESLHATLKFLGAVEEGALGDLAGVLASQLVTSPFHVRVAGLGAFPSPRRANVLWAGVEDGGTHRLAALATEVDVIGGEHGYPRDDGSRPFRGHVTLARVRRGDVDAEAALAVMSAPSSPTASPEGVSDRRSIVFGSMEIASITIFESRPGPGGSTYIPRARIPLGAETDKGDSHGTREADRQNG